MRRFSLYRRKSTFYVQFWNENTGTYASGISTRERSRNAALAVVADWQRNGIPVRERSVDQVICADTAIRYVRGADLTYKDAQRIVEELDSRGLLRSPDDPASEALVRFLTRFWGRSKRGRLTTDDCLRNWGNSSPTIDHRTPAPTTDSVSAPSTTDPSTSRMIEPIAGGHMS